MTGVSSTHDTNSTETAYEMLQKSELTYLARAYQSNGTKRIRSIAVPERRAYSIASCREGQRK